MHSTTTATFLVSLEPLPANTGFPEVPAPKLEGGEAGLELSPGAESSFFPTICKTLIANLSLEFKQEQGKAAGHQNYTGVVCQLLHLQPA